jgi:N-acetylmuramoyl-L-alanine amidase
MPGVLVEIGFITNIEEEAYLNSEKGQFDVAVAIYRAIKGYKDDLEK